MAAVNPAQSLDSGHTTRIRVVFGFGPVNYRHRMRRPWAARVSNFADPRRAACRGTLAHMSTDRTLSKRRSICRCFGGACTTDPMLGPERTVFEHPPATTVIQNGHAGVDASARLLLDPADRGVRLADTASLLSMNVLFAPPRRYGEPLSRSCPRRGLNTEQTVLEDAPAGPYSNGQTGVEDLVEMLHSGDRKLR
jgi:hypothetical protein